MTRNTKYLSYICFFILLLIIVFAGQFDLPEGKQTLGAYLGIIAVFDYFLAEFCVLLLIANWLVDGRLFSRILLYLLTFFYIAICTIQLSSFFMVKEFISRLALDNLNHIELLLSTTATVLVVFFVMFYFVLLFSIEKSAKEEGQKQRPKTLQSFVLFFTIIFFSQSQYWMPEKLNNERDSILKENFLTHTAPLTSLLQTLHIRNAFRKNGELETHFSRYEQKVLKKYRFQYNEALEYPFIKEFIYSAPPPFPKISESPSSPNIIIFFTEGFSARSMAPYGTSYKDITPNLDEFSETSMVVDNYYNHTGATYRGLHGQLCSLFPTYGGVGGWQTNFDDIPQTSYLCLSHIFNRHDYETVFLDAHKPKAAQVDEMVARLGFKEVLTGDILLEKYLKNQTPQRKDSISDKQLYKGLIGFLKEREDAGKTGSPFFMGMYNLGTHAFINIPEDGNTYSDGKNRSLNKIHTLDTAFGIFWDYYKSSSFADNTILVFTADHCHYPEKPFVEAFKAFDYQPIFVDRIPLIIHDPTRSLPKRYNANLATSIGLAPSLLHYLDLGNHPNPFLGSSIFEKKTNNGDVSLGLNSYGDEIYLTASDGIHKFGQSNSFPLTFEILRKFVKVSKYLEIKDKLWDPNVEVKKETNEQ